LVVAWANEQMEADPQMVAGAIGLTGPNSWRCASSRARALLRREPVLREVVPRALGLLSGSRLGSDPNRDQRAARAAS
jgi:hypothetical protein